MFKFNIKKTHSFMQNYITIYIHVIFTFGNPQILQEHIVLWFSRGFYWNFVVLEICSDYHRYNLLACHTRFIFGLNYLEKTISSIKSQIIVKPTSSPFNNYNMLRVNFFTYDTRKIEFIKFWVNLALTIKSKCGEIRFFPHNVKFVQM